MKHWGPLRSGSLPVEGCQEWYPGRHWMPIYGHLVPQRFGRLPAAALWVRAAPAAALLETRVQTGHQHTVPSSDFWRPQHSVLKWDLASGKRVAWNTLSYDIYVIAFDKAFFCWCLLIKSYKELSSLILRFERLCAFLKSYHLPFLCLISAHKW